MGVINLGVLVKKIMGKIAGAGYVKDTDYASSTKGGTIKTDSTYATDITDAGKLKSKTITAEGYVSANASAFVSKGTLDNLIASGAVGGVTWTKLYEGIVSASGTGTFDEGVDALAHKMIILQTIHDNGVTGHGACKLDIVPAATNTIKISVARSTSLYEITVTRTGFTFPSNMSANNFIVYVLD